jgi:hypothetical protein
MIIPHSEGLVYGEIQRRNQVDVPLNKFRDNDGELKWMLQFHIHSTFRNIKLQCPLVI